MKSRTGATRLCSALASAGVNTVFGIPGTQTVPLFEAFRQSGLRTVVPTTELAAAFLANGYFRSSGKLCAVSTIPGPGLTYTLPGLAEAHHDSAGFIYIVSKARTSVRKFALQALDQVAVLRPVVKSIITVDTPGSIDEAVHRAAALALSGEPGPVVLECDPIALDESSCGPAVARPSPCAVPPAPEEVDRIGRRLSGAKRPVFLVGQGGASCASVIQELSAKLRAPVITTRSGRGVIPEDDRWSLRFDQTEAGLAALNKLLGLSDLILCLGCKLTHNGSYGFRLNLPKEKLIHVDASAEVLEANYPASIALESDAGAFVTAISAQLDIDGDSCSSWDPELLKSVVASGIKPEPEPRYSELRDRTPAGFFTEIASVLPRKTILVTDSGLHQVLTNRHWRVLSSRGLLLPTDFQSMGFGLPAALGAAIACPDRPVVALIGDGGLAMSAMEIGTAVREKIPLTVIVFCDGALGQIRVQQLTSYGHAHGTELRKHSLPLLAKALGASYARLQGSPGKAVRQAVDSGSVTLLEVNVEDSSAIHFQKLAGVVRGTVRRLLPASALQRIKSQRK